MFDGPGQPVGAALAGKGRRLHQGPHTLLEEEGIRFRLLEQKLLERGEAWIVAEQRFQQLPGALGQQRIEPHLITMGHMGSSLVIRRGPQPCAPAGRARAARRASWVSAASAPAARKRGLSRT